MSDFLSVFIPVPHEIRRRAWERAHVLFHDYGEHLDHAQQIEVRSLIPIHPHHFRWHTVGRAFTLFAAIVDKRQ